MSVESRIATLYRSGKRGDAAVLAREALKNDTVQAVGFGADSVEVVTSRFVGRHDIADWTDGEAVVEERGQYALRDDDDVTFTVNTLYDNVFAAIDEAERDTPRPEADAAEKRVTF